MNTKTINQMKRIKKIREILENETFLSMNSYNHHGNITCLEHALKVAELTFRLSFEKKLDFISATRAALLHDFYLYDWHIDSPGLHGFRHPSISLKNAEYHFQINAIEGNAILRHMWPLTPIPPSSPEGKVVSMADKLVTLHDYLSLVKKIKAR